MIFVHISDTHCMHKRVKVPNGDCLIVSGDFCGSGSFREIIDFNAWLATQPHAHKIVIAGNHDCTFEEDPHFARSLLTNAIYLEDSEVTIEGIRIYGSPWQPEFNDWAFNLPRGDALKAKWDLIPRGVDILVTHSPPYGILDSIPGRALGCEELRTAVFDIKPAFHLFGHIHHSYGTITIDDITFINSAICTEAYNPINIPHVFEFIKK